MNITLPAILMPLHLKVDRSATLKFATRELTPQEVKEIVEQHNQEGYVLFAPNPIQAAAIPKVDAETKQKTPGQRLRAVLFVKYTQLGEPTGDFERFYADEMEEFISTIKSELI
jgi:hypothetical protein